IEDNGSGLTESEFLDRWRTLAYDRTFSQGKTVLVGNRRRTVFGKNGVGRFAGFCFGDSYFVASNKDEEHIEYEVEIGGETAPFSLRKYNPISFVRENGTRLFVTNCKPSRISEEDVRSEI